MTRFRDKVPGLTESGIIDDRLREAETYTYSCNALINGVMTLGTTAVQGTTVNLNPPAFAGVDAVALSAPGEVSVTWKAVGDGPAAANFKVYMSPGTAAPAITGTPVAELEGNVRQLLVPGLGDELKYSFAVSACTASGLCAAGPSGQVVSRSSSYMPDTDVPTTPGAVSAQMSQGNGVIVAPWEHSMGALAKRYLYIRPGPGTTQEGITVAGEFYEKIKTEIVTDRYAPPTEIIATNLSSETVYRFVVRDEDSFGQMNSSTAIVTLQSGDTTPPSFTGIDRLLAGQLPETQLKAELTAIAPEGSGAGQSAEGASHYLFYTTQVEWPEDVANMPLPPDPCQLSTPILQVAASAYSEGELVSTTLADLTPRRVYRVCVKARDLAGNISNTNTSLSRSTQDRTAPVFDGVQSLSYNNSTNELQVRWNAASSPTADVRNYQVTLWRCAAGVTGDCIQSAEVVIRSQSYTSEGNQTTGINLLRDVFSPQLTGGNRVSVRVDACDTASPRYSSVDNCTATASIRTITLPDVDPPPGFSGIVAAQAVSGQEGVIRASWQSPADWSDYRGFRVYSVTPDAQVQPVLLRDCACVQAGCPSQPLFCDVTGLSARQTYDLIVRAYDSVGNLTALQESPFATARTATTLDLTPPVFVSNLSASFVSSGTRGVNLSWVAATDNQASGALSYRIYRKVGATFIGLTATTPPSDAGALLTITSSIGFINGVEGLAANSTEYYAVCAFDASENISCDAAAVRAVAIPRLAPPVFSGLQSAVAGGSGNVSPETSVSITFRAVESEVSFPATGATDYSIYTIDVDPRADGSPEPANACTSTSPAPTLRGTIPGTEYVANQEVTHILSGLTSRRKYSICLKARDSTGGESNTVDAQTVITQDQTPPAFNGITNAVYNGVSGSLDITWTKAASSDNVRNYSILLWKNSETPVNVVTVTRNPTLGTGTQVESVSSTDFPFASNDEIRVLVNACDDAAPTFAVSDNCTAFPSQSARILLTPDVDAPVGFLGIVSATDASPRATGRAVVTWANLSQEHWADILGFKVYHVAEGNLTQLRTCSCSAYGCPEKMLSCELTGLNAGRTYNFYVRAYDAAGNESPSAEPNPITRVASLRVADIDPPAFTSNLSATYSGANSRIELSWSAAVDNQYAQEVGNTVGYRVYRKTGLTGYSNTNRATIEAEGTELTHTPDTSLTFYDPLAGLADGETYHYTVCAFDRDPTAGNTTCDGVVRNITLADTTPPTLTNLAGSRESLNMANPTFNLTWTPADNTSSPANILVTVRRMVTDIDSQAYPEQNDAVYQQGFALTSLSNEEGLPGENTRIAYRFSVTDQAGNTTSNVLFEIFSYRLSPTASLGVFSQSHVRASTSTTLIVSYTNTEAILANDDFLAKVSLNATGGATCEKSVAGEGILARSISLSDCQGNGTIQISLAAGTASGLGGNVVSAAGPSAVLTVDNTLPVVASFILANGAVDLYLNAADVLANLPVAALLATGYDIDDYAIVVGNTALCTAGFSYDFADVPRAGQFPSANGVSYSLCARVADFAGNTVYSLLASPFTVDNTPPAAPLVTGNSYTTQTRPLWSWTTGGGGSSTYRYKLNDNDLLAGATETTLSFFSPEENLEDGAYTLYVQERDGAGNWSASGSFAITVDTVPPSSPTISGIALTNNNRPTWAWSAGGGGNGTYRYKLNNSDLSSGATTTTSSLYTPESDLPDAAQTLYVQERDTAGNWSASGSFAITVDTTPPNTPVVSIEALNILRPVWTWISGGNGGAGHYRYRFNNSDMTTGTTETPSPTFSPPSNLTEGTYALYVQERDAAGNWSTTGSQSILVQPRATLSLSPENVENMNIANGSSPGESVTFTVQNTGTRESWTLADLTIAGEYSTNFEVHFNNCTGQILPIGASCDFALKPKALSNRIYTATVTVSDGETVSNTVALSGESQGFIPVLDMLSYGKSSQRRAFFDAASNRHWAFYTDVIVSPPTINYESSEDGETWTPVGNLSIATTDYSVSARDGNVYIAFAHNGQVFARQGTITSSSITWGASTTVFTPNFRERYHSPSTALDDSSRLWVAALRSSDNVGADRAFVRRTSLAEDLSSWNAAMAVGEISTGVQSLVILPRNNNDMFLVVQSSAVLAYSYSADSESWSAAPATGQEALLAIPGTGGFFGAIKAAVVWRGFLVIGGDNYSYSIGGVASKYIAKWDGSAWSALGTGVNNMVFALAVDGTGNLYAGGGFTKAGGGSASGVAKWDGSAWSALGSGLNDYVYAIAVDGSGNLYAGGKFSTAGAGSASRVAKWDGSGWSALGAGANGEVKTLAVDGNGNLYAGGSFSTAGGGSASRVAKWDGSAWSALGTGADNTVSALAFDGSGNLYAGGSFSTAGGGSASRVAKWDGSTWSALGAGVSSDVYALAFDGSGNLYAGGRFYTAGGVNTSGVAKWDGSAWSALGAGVSSDVYAIAVDGSGNLYAGGNFTTAGGMSGVRRIAKWNGSAWSTLGNGFDKYVRQIAIDAGGNLYAGGDFSTVGGVNAYKIAKWNGSAWSPLPGLNDTVYTLAVDGAGNLYAGGYFNGKIAKWSGSAWISLGGATTGTVEDIAFDGEGNVYAGGNFTAIDGVSANKIAKWDGSTWSAMGSGLNGQPTALAFAGGNLYAGGYFTTAGGVTALYVAKWDGSAWSALGDGVNGSVTALAFDGTGNLYAGGSFTTAGGVPANRIAKWDGSTWSALGTGVNGFVTAIAFDSAGNLYAGGYFTTAGGINATSTAKWNGVAWSKAFDLVTLSPSSMVRNGESFFLLDNAAIYKSVPAVSASIQSPVSAASDRESGDVFLLNQSPSGDVELKVWNQSSATWGSSVSLATGVTPGSVVSLAYDEVTNRGAGFWQNGGDIYRRDFLADGTLSGSSVSIASGWRVPFTVSESGDDGIFTLSGVNSLWKKIEQIFTIEN